MEYEGGYYLTHCLQPKTQGETWYRSNIIGPFVYIIAKVNACKESIQILRWPNSNWTKHVT